MNGLMTTQKPKKMLTPCFDTKNNYNSKAISTELKLCGKNPFGDLHRGTER